MRAQWIIGPRGDLGCFLLPAVSGYALLYLNTIGISSFVLWWFWNVSVNGPHFFATISRTYLDREEWRERRTLLLASLGFILLGPAVIALCIALETRVPFVLFWLFQAYWAYHHVVRQHYGFMALYQRRNAEKVGRDNTADFWIFNLLMFGPALIWFLQYPEMREAMGWRMQPGETEGLFLDVLGALVLVAVATFLGKEALRWVRTRQVNVPKILLLVAYVPLHLLLFMHPAIATRFDLLLVNAVVTYPHSVQYMAFVWFYNRNRYGADGAGARYGLASQVSRSLLVFLGCSAVFGLVFFYTEWFFEARHVPLAVGGYRGAGTPLGQGFELAHLVQVTWLGVIFNHYYLDQKIWHIRSDAKLKRDLQLDVAA